MAFEYKLMCVGQLEVKKKLKKRSRVLLIGLRITDKNTKH